MTPREWWRLAIELEENIPSWEWTADGKAIRVTGDRVSISIGTFRDSWVVECEDEVKIGGYYDPPEYRFSHNFITTDIDDVVDHVQSLLREARYV